MYVLMSLYTIYCMYDQACSHTAQSCRLGALQYVVRRASQGDDDKCDEWNKDVNVKRICTKI